MGVGRNVVGGRKPKPADQKVHRGKPTHEWTEVKNEPFTGKPPARPPARRQQLTPDGDLVEVPLTRLARSWWRVVSKMPHCVLWSTSDWQFAVETCLVADNFYRGHHPSAAELRMREARLGTTIDARRDLRIRYVAASTSAPTPEPSAAAQEASVTMLDERRRRLTDDDAP